MTTDILSRTVRGVDRALLTIAAVGLLAMMLHIGADIAASLLFNRPIATTSAIVTQYYMIAVAFLPILATERRGAHISITMITAVLPLPVQRGLQAVVTAIMAVAYWFLTVQAWQQAADKFEIKAYMVEQTSRILVWPSYFIIPVAFGAMALLMTAKAVLAMTGRNTDIAPVELTKPAPAGARDV